MGRKTAALGLLAATSIIACESSTAPPVSEADAAPQTALMSSAGATGALQAAISKSGSSARSLVKASVSWPQKTARAASGASPEGRGS